MTPLLGGRLLDLAPPGSLPDWFGDVVSAALTRSRAQATALEALTVWIVRALEQAGVPCLPLKGPLLARSLHSDPGRRAGDDVDLLVSAAELPRAVEIMGGLGFGLLPGRLRSNGLPELHHRLRDAERRLPVVEVHWRVHWYEEKFSAEMLTRSALSADGVRVAHAEDELAALLLFYARDAFVGLKFSADIAAWWDRHGPAPGGPWLASHLRRHPRLARALVTATWMVERVAGVPSTELVGTARPGRRGLIAARLANPSLEPRGDQALADVSLVDWLLSPPRGTGAFASRQLILTGAPVPEPERSRRAARRRRLIAGAMHPPKLLARHGLGLARTVRAGPPGTVGEPLEESRRGVADRAR